MLHVLQVLNMLSINHVSFSNRKKELECKTKNVGRGLLTFLITYSLNDNSVCRAALAVLGSAKI